jgi:tRNA threonylcarbamoyladenosine biosynthesis protein TsaE
MIYTTASEEETIALGTRLAPELRGLVLLIGNLGAGKTTLVKGIVGGGEVTSPTFTLIHDYETHYHIDLYRLETEREVEGLGIDELVESGKPVLIEWGERFPRLFPPPVTEICLENTGDDTRRITVSYR